MWAGTEHHRHVHPKITYFVEHMQGVINPSSCIVNSSIEGFMKSISGRVAWLLMKYAPLSLSSYILGGGQ
jgi:hypothetical protein